MIPLSEFLAKIVVWIARTPFPRPIQCWINRWYVNWFDIDMEQFETEDPCKYPTLNDLFIRYKKVIEFYEDEEIVISPADAKVIADGEIEKGMALQVKKIPYKVSQLVGEEVNLDGGFFINLYLSPRDYHRFHVPIDMEVLKARYIPGKLKSVRPSVIERELVYPENRRVVLECKDIKGNRFFIVLIGAIIVGKIVINFDPDLGKNPRKYQEKEYQGLKLKKGEELGRFEFGSSIVLLFPPDGFKYLNQKEEVEVGDILGESY
ncbi:MAG: phosphatidylserine decarboxylase [Epsilonproteobacteria bacterium]|nr:phosphatidylserine decarboxylase [Campylobacterota bacterium]NPA89662.1 phosphatidylserine decarboxylase [Campylobacterota bacterium]